jgi:hypothetical protein
MGEAGWSVTVAKPRDTDRIDVARLHVGSRVDAVAMVLIETNVEVEALGWRGTIVGGTRSNDKVDRAVVLDLCMVNWIEVSW